jgi:hypothetical protein
VPRPRVGGSSEREERVVAPERRRAPTGW